MRAGHVYFVGAGPGDPELLTLRAARIICEAEVIIYADSLLPPSLLDNRREEAVVYGSSTMSLEQIVEIMVTSAGEGKKVARLVCGDPALYSALSEQAEALRRAGIPYKVVPGVSSFSAAAASLGMELTCPELSQAVVLARIGGRTPLPRGFSVSDISHPGATMVFFLSAGMAERIRDELYKAGFHPRSPAVVVYRVGWEDESLFFTDLSDLPRAIERHGTERQALVIVGEILREGAREGRRSRLYGESAKHGSFGT